MKMHRAKNMSHDADATARNLHTNIEKSKWYAVKMMIQHVKWLLVSALVFLQIAAAHANTPITPPGKFYSLTSARQSAMGKAPTKQSVRRFMPLSKSPQRFLPLRGGAAKEVKLITGASEEKSSVAKPAVASGVTNEQAQQIISIFAADE